MKLSKVGTSTWICGDYRITTSNSKVWGAKYYVVNTKAYEKGFGVSTLKEAKKRLVTE